jgi:hypothetical protein
MILAFSCDFDNILRGEAVELSEGPNGVSEEDRVRGKCLSVRIQYYSVTVAPVQAMMYVLLIL